MSSKFSDSKASMIFFWELIKYKAYSSKNLGSSGCGFFWSAHLHLCQKGRNYGCRLRELFGVIIGDIDIKDHFLEDIVWHIVVPLLNIIMLSFLLNNLLASLFAYCCLEIEG